MKLEQIIKRLEEIAPTHLAESWDNVGLLAGDPYQDISRILLTIDYTPDVAEEARAHRCDLVVAYHPPIFTPLKRLVAGHAVFDAIRRGIAIYSPHTALDVAPGGTNDILADVVGMTDRKPLKIAESKPSQYKLVVFVPVDAVEKVSSALFDAGAGRIGNYSSCSFRSTGTGTFFGEQGTHPAAGQAGRLEKVDEIRLETVVPLHALSEVVRALKSAHPYEEPAFDLNMLAVPPDDRGQGRIGPIPPTERNQLFDRIKRELNLTHLLIAGPSHGIARHVAVCAGSCGQFLEDAIRAGADLFLTGEIRHHDAIRAASAGVTVVCTLHSNSERAVLSRLAKKLAQLKGIPHIHISEKDRDPFVIY